MAHSIPATPHPVHERELDAPLASAWSIFFAAVSLVIVMCFMLPGLFGLQSFTQWGGMYTDGWCQARLYSVSTDVTENLIATTYPPSRLVWYSPMFNPKSCIAWVQSWCREASPSGWLVVSAYAYHRGHYLAGTRDVCTLAPFPPAPWFQR